MGCFGCLPVAGLGVSGCVMERDGVEELVIASPFITEKECGVVRERKRKRGRKRRLRFVKVFTQQHHTIMRFMTDIYKRESVQFLSINEDQRSIIK